MLGVHEVARTVQVRKVLLGHNHVVALGAWGLVCLLLLEEQVSLVNEAFLGPVDKALGGHGSNDGQAILVGSSGCLVKRLLKLVERLVLRLERILATVRLGNAGTQHRMPRLELLATLGRQPVHSLFRKTVKVLFGGDVSVSLGKGTLFLLGKLDQRRHVRHGQIANRHQLALGPIVHNRVGGRLGRKLLPPRLLASFLQQNSFVLVEPDGPNRRRKYLNCLGENGLAVIGQKRDSLSKELIRIFVIRH
mmetsp:Transcript_4759/g.15386  ORF Transcript_4759/g.15386 Transcript_4759/m.15386 type:complete len:249 (+) Transcript_4759:927-1673(+)